MGCPLISRSVPGIPAAVARLIECTTPAEQFDAAVVLRPDELQQVVNAFVAYVLGGLVNCRAKPVNEKRLLRQSAFKMFQAVGSGCFDCPQSHCPVTFALAESGRADSAIRRAEQTRLHRTSHPLHQSVTGLRIRMWVSHGRYPSGRSGFLRTESPWASHRSACLPLTQVQADQERCDSSPSHARCSYARYSSPRSRS